MRRNGTRPRSRQRFLSLGKYHRRKTKKQRDTQPSRNQVTPPSLQPTHLIIGIGEQDTISQRILYIYLRVETGGVPQSGVLRHVPRDGMSGGESAAFHASLRLRVFHECFPDKSGSRVLRHQHGDSRVDSDNVAAVPVCQRIECVYESITVPRASSIAVSNRAEDANRFLWKEWQRPGRGAGNHGSIDRARCRRPSPHDIAFRRIRGRDAPKVFAVVGELRSQVQTEAPMDSGGDDRVLEIVGILVMLVAKIKPSLGILMNEERSERTDIADAVVFECRPFPSAPGFSG